MQTCFLDGVTECKDDCGQCIMKEAEWQKKWLEKKEACPFPYKLCEECLDETPT